MSVLAVAGLSGCLLSPPILERPADLDEQVVFFDEDVTPPNGGPVLLNRDEGDVIDFGINEIRHADVDDEVEFRFFLVDQEDEIPVSSGFLRVDQERSEEEGTTIYAPVLFPVDACSAELALKPDGAGVTIRLELHDLIPAEEFPVTERLEWFNQVIWDVELDGAPGCEQEDL